MPVETSVRAFSVLSQRNLFAAAQAPTGGLSED